MHLTCSSGNVDFKIDRWKLHRKKAETVQWNFKSDAHSVAQIVIAAKDPITWKFDPAGPYTAVKGQSASATVLDGADAGPHKYTITGICAPNGSDTPDTVTIDPDIVVD